jgi:hypothetical protein
MFTTVLTVEPRTNACFGHPTHGLFLTCTGGMFFFISDTHTLCARIIKYRTDCMGEKTLTWNGASSYMVVNPHPCWSLA